MQFILPLYIFLRQTDAQYSPRNLEGHRRCYPYRSSEVLPGAAQEANGSKAQKAAAAKLRTVCALRNLIGPLRSLATTCQCCDATRRSGRSCIAQHFFGRNVDKRDKAWEVEPTVLVIQALDRFDFFRTTSSSPFASSKDSTVSSRTP